jgi:membrane peptidoglycan carboxypeptidase
LQVKTSLDLDVQNIAERIVEEEVTKANSLNVYNGAMVAMDPKSAQIVAMVGSKGYTADPEPAGCVSGGTEENSCKFDPYVNVVTSLRQPGSAIKPVTYATMLGQGYTVSFPFLDVPTRFQGSSPDKPYIPVNYDGKFRGIVSLRRALANSLNIPAVKTLKIVGIDNMIDTAEKMGISTFTDRQRYGLALTLGGGETRLLELTGAYNVFAAKGVYRKPSPIIEVKDSSGNLIYKNQENNGKQAITPEVAFLISDILSDDGARSDAFGAGSLLNIKGHQVAVKTGTTDDKRDNYAIGFTPSLTVGVWVGNSNNEKMNPYVSSGISGATPIWHNFFTEYLLDKTAEKFETPEKVKKIEIDRLTGMLPEDDSERRSEWFVLGTEPTAKSNWYRRLEICKIDGRIANDGCKDADETTTKTFIKVQAELPEWQYGADAWVKENYTSEDKYFPPQMTSTLEFDGDEVSNKDDVNVGIIDLKDGDTVFLDFRLNVEVSSYEDVERVTFYMDGEKYGEDKSLPYGMNFNLDGNKIGRHEFEVTVTDEKGNKGSKKLKLNVVGYSL